MKLEDYKGYKVIVNEDGMFRALKANNEEIAKAETMAGLKEDVDKFDRKKIARFVAYKKDYEDGFKKITVTSVNTHTKEAWVVDDNKYREKVHMGYSDKIIKDTPANLIRMADLTKLYVKETAIKEQIRAIEKKLTYYQIKESD